MHGAGRIIVAVKGLDIFSQWEEYVDVLEVCSSMTVRFDANCFLYQFEVLIFTAH
jgi:hypothetical protein